MGENFGCINFNNMLPVIKGYYEQIDFNINNIEKNKYMIMLLKQYRWINKNKEIIFEKSTKLYNAYIENKLSDIIKQRCCDFELLNKLCLEYIEK